MSSKGKNRRENRGKAQKNIKAASKLRWRWADWIVFNATVFVAAGCIMSVEILSTRLVAPFLGSSLYTWTSAIGVVLAGISLGNYLGGRIADRFHPKRTLSLLFIISSVSCVTIPMVNSWMGTWAALDGLSWPTRIFLHFVFTFLLPATMLGTMSPVVAKMALNMGQSTGRTIGTIYAWGSIGSIVGTFVAGFFLVAWMGTERAIFAIAGVLAVVGILYGYRSWVPYAWSVAYTATMICAFVPWAWTQPIESLLGLSERNEESILFKKDSHYQRVVVKEVGTNLRKMVLDKLVHSQVNLADPLELKYNYEVIYSEVMRTSHPSNEPVTAMVMGGGGYVFPRYLEIMYPDSYVEVAEIDPVVTQAAFEAFGLPENTSIKYNNIDARNRIADLIRQKREGVKVPAFDFILGDSFSDFTVPYHLTTVEFNKLLYDLLSDDGIYMLNLIDMFSSGRFLGAVVNTCGKVFPHVAVFSTEALQSERNTFIVISSKLPLDVKGTLRSIQAKHPFRGSLLKPKHLDQLMKKNNHLVLTDDYAPVENLLAEVVQAYTKTTGKTESLVSKRLQDDIAGIESLFKKGDFDQVGARAQEALKFYPNATNIHFLLGSALARQGKLNQAIAEFRTELQVTPSHPQSRLSMARAYNLLGDKKAALKQYQLALNVDPKDPSIRCALAALLLESGNQEEAEKYYRLTIQDRPGYVKAYVGLGNLLSKKRNVAESISIWEQALRLNPAYPGLSHDLALSLFHAGKYNEAIIQFRQALALEPESAVLHNELGRTLGISGNKAAAVDAFSQAVRRAPENASYRANLGLVLQEVGRDEEAVFQYREVLKLHNKNLPVMNALAKLLSTSSDPTIRDGAEAVKLAERLCDLFGRNQPQALETLAAAYAEVGRFPEAVAAAQRAVAFAQKRKMENLANKIRKELALYETGQPSRTIL